MKCKKCNRELDVVSLLGKYYRHIAALKFQEAWTDEEDNLIEDTLDKPLREIVELFPNRTRAAVHCRRRDHRNGKVKNIKNFKLQCECGAEVDIEELKLNHTQFRWNKTKRRRYKGYQWS